MYKFTKRFIAELVLDDIEPVIADGSNEITYEDSLDDELNPQDYDCDTPDELMDAIYKEEERKRKEWYKEISDGVPEKYRDFVHDCQCMWSDNVLTPLTVTHIKYDQCHERYIIRFNRIIEPSEYHWVFQLIEQVYTPWDGNTTTVMPKNLQIINEDICTIFKINGVADYIG